MKKLMIVAILILVSAVSAQAQMDDNKPCANKCQGMSMETCQHKPMMQHMMKHKMMTQEIMGMMKETLTMQKKMLESVKPAEKKEMMMELSRMMDKIDAMLAEMKDEVTPGMKCETPCDACKKMEQKSEAPVKE